MPDASWWEKVRQQRDAKMPKPKAIDYKALLTKYIQYVRDAEGVDFLTHGERRHEVAYGGGLAFTDDEWAELEELAERIELERLAGEPD